MPHTEYLQVLNFNISYTPVVTTVELHDIPMPKCSNRQICNIHAVETVHDASSTGIRWVLLLSLDPSDQFQRDNAHHQESNDTFYKRVHWQISGAFAPPNNHRSNYPYPFPYPYEKMRMGLRQSSLATGSTWNILIYYTIESITPAQLTAITIRRGTVKHAREQGPEAI